MSPTPRADRFRYDGFTVDPAEGTVTCTYSTGDHHFTERYHFGTDGDWSDPAVEAAARVLFLLAGVSYYKTTAPLIIDLGVTPTTPAERGFLLHYYREGLGEFAYRNDLDLGGLVVVSTADDSAPIPEYQPDPGRPLIPFGGGIDSIVTVESLRPSHPEAALCIVGPPGERFAAIEAAAAATGLPIAHVTREIDAQVRRSAELKFLNGHVPITAVLTATAVLAAVLARRDAVVLSNEWSASVPTLLDGDRPINHQWSKGDAFEREFAQLIRQRVGPRLSVFSYLRPRSELWVAQQFAGLTQFHQAFRSCNRAFHQNPAERLDHWCARCDKCCFIDLILSPFMSADALNAVFTGDEPLRSEDNAARFRSLIGVDSEAKPFECVGDVGECRAAVLLAAEREDRQGTPLLQSLRELVIAAQPADTVDRATLLAPIGSHYIPERYASPDLLVRAR
jgi:UDP-N-acetyl-alpha-D-muramoyl-L-alanyl-L-glutamate epimerase